MAEVKISALPAATEITSDDTVPVVDSGTTKKATFQQILDYVTGSTFSDLTVTSLTASVSGTFVGDGSGITGVTAEWDGTHVGDAQITGALAIQKNYPDWGLELYNADGALNGQPGLTMRTLQNGFGIGGSTTGQIWSSRITGSLVSNAYVQLQAPETDQPSIYMAVSGNHSTGAHGGTTQAAHLKLSNESLFHGHYDPDDNTAFWTYSYPRLTYVALGMSGTADCVITAGKSGTGDANLVLRTSNSSSGEAERMRIDVSGNVGIGTSTPAVKLDVSGSIIADVEISGAVGSEITSTSYSLSADDRGKTLLFSSSATQGITCSSGLNVGYNATFIQMGSGQLELSASSGVSILNRQSHTKSAGLYAAVSIVIVSTDAYVLAGDTSA